MGSAGLGIEMTLGCVTIPPFAVPGRGHVRAGTEGLPDSPGTEIQFSSATLTGD